MTKITTILIADDHFTVRYGIEMLVKDILGDACKIVHASSGKEVMELLSAADYDVMVQDMNMPEPSGLQLLEKALAIQPALKILVLSVNREDFFAPGCFQMGAYGFVSKNAGDKELVQALGAVIAGDIYLTEPQKRNFIKNYIIEKKDPNPLKLLSQREKDVSMLLLKGNGVLEVSNELGITPSTVSTFKARVFKKLMINSLLELDQLARRFGLRDDHSAQHEK